MDAVFFRAGILLATTLSLGAGYSSQSHVMGPATSVRSEHFVVMAPTEPFARQVCQAAEQYRRDLAIEWLGHELPSWRDACPIQVTVGRMGAGGATSFEFVGSEPRRWRMSIQGTQERILDSVLPHEITHMILATHLGCPLPRWADEGAATSVEHSSERSKQQKLLIQFLRTNRGIPFNVMFALKDYPSDILPLYSQGYSVARFLIAQGGKPKYVEYVADGIRSNNWTAATMKHYGFSSLSELQTTWNDWVRRGSPMAMPAMGLASYTRPHVAPQQPRPSSLIAAASDLVPLPPRSRRVPRPDTRSTPTLETSARPVSSLENGWYGRQRDLAADQGSQLSTDPPASAHSDAPATQQNVGRPQPPQGPGQIVLEWSRNDQPDSGATIRR